MPKKPDSGKHPDQSSQSSQSGANRDQHQFYSVPSTATEFSNWQDADLHTFLSEPAIVDQSLLAGVPTPATTGPGMQMPKFFAGDDAHTSPSELMYFPPGLSGSGPPTTDAVAPHTGLQVPARFAASMGAQTAGVGFDTPDATPAQFSGSNASPSESKPGAGGVAGAAGAAKAAAKSRRPKSKPCDFCRRRKTKCEPSTESNSCKHCESKGVQCTYTDSRRAGGDGDGSGGKKGRYVVDELHPPPTVPIREVDPVQDYSVMPGYSLLKRTLSLQYPRSSFYIGPSSVYDPLLLDKIQLDRVDQVQLNATTSLRKVAPTVQFTLQDDYTEQLYEMTERNVDAVERFVAPHGKVLIELYFRIVHPSFPVLHKKVFLEKYSRTHREFSAPLLAAVYSLAIQWWDYDPQLSQFPKPNVAALQKLAMQTFAFVIERPKLSAVQAGLLLLQCRGGHPRNWALCSQVVALAEELGLGLDCADWRLPKWERGLRRRLAWAVYVQDKWLSLIESRPSHIAEDRNWSVRAVTDDDFPERSNEPDSSKEGSSDIDNGKVLFRQMIALSQILAEILDSLFSMSAVAGLTRIDQVLKAAKPLQLKLRDWYHSLPPELHMDAVQQRKLNSNGYLQLAYFAAEITLHRKIITTLSRDNPPELVHVCRAAARTRLTAAIEFVRALKPEHIHAFWHSSATANFALIGTFAAILFVTSESPEEANSYKDQVYNYRWILRVSAKGFDQAGAALEKLDTVLFHIPGLFNAAKTDASSAATPGDTKNELSSTPTPQPVQEKPLPQQQQQQQQQQPQQQVLQAQKSAHQKTHSRSSSAVSQQKHSPYVPAHSPYVPVHSPFSQTAPGVQQSSQGPGPGPAHNVAPGSNPNTPGASAQPFLHPSPANSFHSLPAAEVSPRQVRRESVHSSPGVSRQHQHQHRLSVNGDSNSQPDHKKTPNDPTAPSPLANATNASTMQDPLDG